MPAMIEKAARRPRWLTPILLVGSLIAAIPLAEVGARLFLRFQGEPYDGTALLAKFEREADTIKTFTPKSDNRPGNIPANRSLHPFFGSQSGRDPGGVLEHFRKTPPDAAFEVLVVGGSVAMLFVNDAGKDLEANLTADPRLAGRVVRVLNGAHAAYKQPQHLNKVAYLFARGHQPDVVLNLDGFNEVAGGMQNGKTGTNPLHPTPPVWAGLLWGRSTQNMTMLTGSVRLNALKEQYQSVLSEASDKGLMRSAIAGTWVKRRLNRVTNERNALQERILQELAPKKSGKRPDPELVGDPFQAEESSIMEMSVRNWTQCSVSLNAICKARGVHFIQALQPTLWDKDAKLMAAKEKKIEGLQTWRRAVALGYPLLREALPKLKAAGIPTLDLSMAFADVEDELYYDPCHFLPKGSRLLAEPVAEAILAQLP